MTIAASASTKFKTDDFFSIRKGWNLDLHHKLSLCPNYCMFLNDGFVYIVAYWFCAKISHFLNQTCKFGKQNIRIYSNKHLINLGKSFFWRHLKVCNFVDLRLFPVSVNPHQIFTQDKRLNEYGKKLTFLERKTSELALTTLHVLRNMKFIFRDGSQKQRGILFPSVQLLLKAILRYLLTHKTTTIVDITSSKKPQHFWTFLVG